MISKRKGFKNRAPIQSKFLIFILGALFFYFIGILIISNLNIYRKRGEIRSQANLLQEEIKNLEKEKERLEAGILGIKTEDYLEEKARDEWGLKKPGEEVVVVLPLEENQESVISSEKNIWQRILEFLNLK